MTLTQFIDYVRQRHRAESDSNWADEEIYALITARANEILTIIGLLEATDTSVVSVASQQAYDVPTDCIRIRQLNYDGRQLTQISFEEWESEKNESGTTPEGRPELYVYYNRQVLIVPIPADAGDTLTFYYDKEHPYIDGTTQTTIDIPSALHFRLADGVLADMFAKDLNSNFASFYEQKWNQIHIPAFRAYQRRIKRGDKFLTVRDVSWRRDRRRIV